MELFEVGVVELTKVLLLTEAPPFLPLLPVRVSKATGCKLEALPPLGGAP